MGPAEQRARIGCAEAFFHHSGPDSSGRPEFCDFLEEVVVNVKEKTEPGSKFVDGQTCPDAMLDIFNTVSQSERQLLDRGRSGFPDVISADRDRVPARHVASRI